MRLVHDALVAAKADNLVRGSDWPHPRPERPVADAKHLLDLFLAWTEPPKPQKILSVNLVRLYYFPA
jgi:2-pyrone-4,6-dicarboxylate lactonase